MYQIKPHAPNAGQEARMRKRLALKRFLAGMIALLLGAAPAFAQKTAEDPAQILVALYDDVKADRLVAWVNADKRGPPLSKGLVALWAKADALARRRGDELGPVDFDVTTNSQGAPIKSYALKTISRDASRATIEVALIPDNWLRHSPKENILRYQLVNEGDRWAIDDISGTIEPHAWSLRGYLTRYLH
jgi:hypothetical protein